jgi:hypothetical protein
MNVILHADMDVHVMLLLTVGLFNAVTIFTNITLVEPSASFSSTCSSMKAFKHGCTYFALVNSRSLQ